MDEDNPRKRRTTKFVRSRIMERLREGFGYDDIAQEEKLTERRVRQIVAEALEGSEALENAVHAHLQIARLGRAVPVAGEARSRGDIRAVAPLIAPAVGAAHKPLVDMGGLIRRENRVPPGARNLGHKPLIFLRFGKGNAKKCKCLFPLFDARNRVQTGRCAVLKITFSQSGGGAPAWELRPQPDSATWADCRRRLSPSWPGLSRPSTRSHRKLL